MPAAGPLRELAALFLRLGFTAFGGPAAHIAMLEDEVVTRRGWLTHQDFLDFLGVTNLIPGPNSTEMALHVGMARAGWRGLLVAGACFLGPAVLLTGIAAWLYVRFGSVPEAKPLLAGIQAAVLAVIAGALWKLGKKAIKGPGLALLGAGVVAASLLGAGEITLLAASGLLWALLAKARPAKATAAKATGLLALGAAGPASAATTGTLATAAGAAALAPVSLAALGLFFLKIGAVLYGSGYVLIAFLEGGLVDERGWLTRQQLLDAVALGQFTPGPVLSTATFIGYLLAGWPGAIVATAGIFLPSFCFVPLVHHRVKALRKNAFTAALLDGVNVAAMGLIAAVLIQLSAVVADSWGAAAIGLASAVAVLRFRVSALWVVPAGGLLGLVLGALGLL
ncbi:MAG: chromate efflux transporter [Sumerlaeia bacterium]